MRRNRIANTYFLSKSLTERMLMHKPLAREGRLCIVRPSIVGAVAFEPCPGYIGNCSGFTALILGAASGGAPLRIADALPLSMRSLLLLMVHCTPLHVHGLGSSHAPSTAAAPLLHGTAAAACHEGPDPCTLSAGVIQFTSHRPESVMPLVPGDLVANITLAATISTSKVSRARPRCLHSPAPGALQAAGWHADLPSQRACHKSALRPLQDLNYAEAPMLLNAGTTTASCIPLMAERS